MQLAGWFGSKIRRRREHELLRGSLEIPSGVMT